MPLDLVQIKKKASPHLAEVACVSQVLDCYKRIVKKKFNATPFVKVAPDSKTEANCIKIVKLANSLNKSLETILEESFAFFDSEFCMRITKKPYPQITFLVSEKTQGRLTKQNKPTIKVTSKNSEAIADQFMEILNSMDKRMAIDAVKGGWPPDAPEVRRILMKRLKSGKTL